MAHLANLNAAQLSAVTSEADVLQVLAPPGSGKTKTLTSRVAHLLGDRGFLPWNVICLTFTIKSAREMKERVAKLIGENVGNKVILGTFHSVCRRYLAYYGHLIGMKKGFGIADTSDTTGIITRIIKKGKFSVEAKLARSRISSCKAKNVGPEQLLRETTGKKQGVDQHEFVQVYQRYQEYLEISNLLDYDDLLLRCLQLLQEHPGCVNNVQAVLIDEFQDTNSVQFDLMNLFAQRCQHITTVGDPDQSIYGWRNAEVTNLTKMQEKWPETLVINLEQNYRSAGAILEVAQTLIEQDTVRPPKALSATHRRGKAAVFRKLPSATVEAEWIVQEIARSMILSAELLNYGDFAILLRTSSLSRQIESAFGKHGIPYRMVGGAKFFDRVEVKILLDYLRVIAQPDNSDALARIINIPARRIGDATVKALLGEAIEDKTTMWKVVLKASRGSRPRTKLNAPQLSGIDSLVNIILTCQKRLADEDDPASPRVLLELLVKKLSFGTYLEANYKEDHELRWENVEQLLAQADDPLYSFSSESDPEDALPEVPDVEQGLVSGAAEALTKFLANVALSTEVQVQEETNSDGGLKNKVTISTIHAAKGLEWPIVFIPACYQGNIPHSRAENTDEERRLLYVAMTRAQAMLNLSCPIRSSMGEETVISSFIDDAGVKKGLEPQGHMLEYDVIADVASILGRPCPSQERLVEAVRNGGLERIIDDRWPLDGAPEATENEALWTNMNGDSGFRTAFKGAKRRKISEEQAGADAQGEIRSMLYANTTMSGSANFTMPSSAVGFMSANQHMQIQRSVEAVNGVAESQDRGQSSETAPQKSAKSNKARATKREAGQASLASFFGGGKPVTAKPEPIPSMSRENSTQKVAEPLPHASQPTSQPSTTPVPRQPMASAPRVVVNRLMRPASSMTPLRKPVFDISVDRDTSERPGIPATEYSLQHQAENPVVTSAQVDREGGMIAVKAAVTTHSTTVSRLGQTQGGPVRRLGMNGAMKPWSSKSGIGAVRPSSFPSRRV